MEFRRLGRSGLQVPALSLGTATFGGGTPFYRAWGSINETTASRLVDICLEHGVAMFDTADIYSDGLAETILATAIRGKRQRLLLSTKVGLPSGAGPNDFGSSRYHLTRAIDGALHRLGVDHIDVLQLHGQDYNTPIEETLSTLDQVVRAGKVRYIGCSNFVGWHLMKSLMTSDKYGFCRYVAHQVSYSLVNRDYEWELMALGEHEGVGALVWSPLGGASLTGKILRDQPPPSGTRAHNSGNSGYQHDRIRLFRIVEALGAIAAEVGKTIPQVALNWLLERRTVSSIVMGVRDETQLTENIGAVGWKLSDEQSNRLRAASEVLPPYPVWHQRVFPMLNERGSLKP